MQENLSNLENLISTSSILESRDRYFLLSILENISSLDRLKLRQGLMSGMSTQVAQQIDLLKDKFQPKTNPKKPEEKPEEQKRILNISILTQTSYLGGPLPKVVEGAAEPLDSLRNFRSLTQLKSLQAEHVTFKINDNVEQIIRNFLDTLEKLFDNIDDVYKRRCYFMNFLQSNLFSGYLNTGLTALRHPELEPAKVILNTLHQINPDYLNNRQFQHAAVICSQIRNLCGL